jgi:hypothetical protein
MPGYPKKEMAPGKLGVVTDVLMNKNIGIDGKTYQLLDARVDRVKQDNPQIGDQVEYKISASKELTEKGKISFFTITKRNPAPVMQPAVPSEPTKAPEKREPRIIQGQYLSKTGSSITLKDSKGNAEAWPADLDLITFLNKPDCKVKVGDMVKVRLIDNHGEWVAKDMGPFDPSIPEIPFKTGQEILKENLDEKKAEREKADAALAQINKEEAVQKPVETVTETEHANLIARGEAAKMEKIRKEAAEHSERMKKENAARKASEPSLSAPVEVPASFVKSENPSILNPVREEYVDPGEPTEGEHIAPIEVGVHIDMGGYTNFDLKLADISGDRARQRIEGDSMKMIGVMRRLMTAAKKGY